LKDSEWKKKGFPAEEKGGKGGDRATIKFPFLGRKREERPLNL